MTQMVIGTVTGALCQIIVAIPDIETLDLYIKST